MAKRIMYVLCRPGEGNPRPSPLFILTLVPNDVDFIPPQFQLRQRRHIFLYNHDESVTDGHICLIDERFTSYYIEPAIVKKWQCVWWSLRLKSVLCMN